MYASEFHQNSTVWPIALPHKLDSYYEMIQMNSTVPGQYTLVFINNMKIDAEIHESSYDPRNLSNLYLADRQDCDDGRFQLKFYSEFNHPSILLIKTDSIEDTGRFIVVALGPGQIVFTQLREYFNSS